MDTNYAGDGAEFHSAVIIIARSDMKYLMKKNLEQLFYESGHGGMIEDSFYRIHGKVIFQRLLFLRTAAFRKKN